MDQNFASKAAATRAARSCANKLDRLEKLFQDTSETLAEVEEERDQLRRWWHEERQKNEAAASAADAARQQRDNYRTQFEADRELRLKAEAELKQTRGYVEGLLDGMHPTRPVLPWENTISTEAVTFKGPNQ